jgi:hypothetical protein
MRPVGREMVFESIHHRLPIKPGRAAAGLRQA